MASRAEIKQFFTSVTHRALTQATLVMTDENLALQALCAAFGDFASRYAEAPARHLPLLFQYSLHQQLQHQLRLTRRHHRISHALSRLIPPREEDSTLEPLELLAIQDLGPDQNAENWVARADVAQVTAEALTFLPVFERMAFLLQDVEGFNSVDSARILSSTAWRVRRAALQSRQTLAAIFSQKGVTLSLLPWSLSTAIERILRLASAHINARVTQQLAQGQSDACQALLPDLGGKPGLGVSLDIWRVRHPLALRQALGTGLILALFAGLWRQVPPPAPVACALDAQMLASDARLDILLNPDFSPGTDEAKGTAGGSDTADQAIQGAPASPIWAQLNPHQQSVLASLSVEWNRLAPAHKQRLLNIVQYYDRFTLTQQQRVQSKLKPWVDLPQEQQDLARAHWQALTAMTAPQRTRLLTRLQTEHNTP